MVLEGAPDRWKNESKLREIKIDKDRLRISLARGSKDFQSIQSLEPLPGSFGLIKASDDSPPVGGRVPVAPCALRLPAGQGRNCSWAGLIRFVGIMLVATAFRVRRWVKDVDREFKFDTPKFRFGLRETRVHVRG